MPACQPLRKPIPRIWLMTDPRLGDELLASIQRLPMGSGVIFRHYQLDATQRRKLFAKVRRVCAKRGHIVFLAGDGATARAWHADGVYGRRRSASLHLHSAPVHNAREIAAAKRFRADILFLSPLRATQSHPGNRPLGPVRFKTLAKMCQPAKVIALGGMNRAQAAKWPCSLVHGWAAIDAFRTQD
ncbi:thiamine phosphate synthase [Sphingorhabdus sp.]|uniref:thiamine phosphate synthase n=1 Tax=Sphingorhabdus sp. TaxID=1902408 RepID=UPI0032B7DD59